MRATVRIPQKADNYHVTTTHVKEQLADAFGGFTAYETEGGWVNDSGELIEEPVTVIETYGDSINPEYIKALCRHVKTQTTEESVMGTVGGESFFV